jgi:hypothetical protein
MNLSQPDSGPDSNISSPYCSLVRPYLICWLNFTSQPHQVVPDLSVKLVTLSQPCQVVQDNARVETLYSMNEMNLKNLFIIEHIENYGMHVASI